MSGASFMKCLRGGGSLRAWVMGCGEYGIRRKKDMARGRCCCRLSLNYSLYGVRTFGDRVNTFRPQNMSNMQIR